VLRAAPILVMVASTGCGALVGIQDITFQTDGGADDGGMEAESSVDPQEAESGIPIEEAGSEDASADAVEEVNDDAQQPPPCIPTKTGSDPHNCGQCWHDCLGADCVNGHCQAILLAQGLSGRPGALAVPDDGYAYWINGDDGRISRKKTDASEFGSGNLVPTHMPGLDLAVDDKYIFFTTKTDPTSAVYRVNKDSTGNIDTISPDWLWAGKLALSDTEVFFTAVGHSSVVARVAKVGPDGDIVLSPEPDDATSPPAFDCIAIDDVFVYVTDVGRNLVLRTRRDAKPTDPPEIIAEAAGPTALQVYGGFVYWADSEGIFRRKTDLSGAAEALAIGFSATAMAIDFYWIYWISADTPSGGSGNVIYRASNNQKTVVPTTFWSTQGRIGDLAIDDWAVYFTGPTDYEVYKLAK
jgi:hypothetical protein